MAKPLLSEDTVGTAVSAFVEDAVRPYLDRAGAEDEYPGELISRMRDLGLFGLTIPKQLGGLELGRHATVVANRELSAGWQSLSALLGTHWRVCLYFQQCG